MSYAFDPELAAFAEMLPTQDLGDVAQARAGLAGLIAPLNASVDTSGIVVTDHQVPRPEGTGDILVRVYAPDGDAPAGGRPALLDLHGGGFCVGDAEMEHAFC